MTLMTLIGAQAPSDGTSESDSIELSSWVALLEAAQDEAAMRPSRLLIARGLRALDSVGTRVRRFEDGRGFEVGMAYDADNLCYMLIPVFFGCGMVPYRKRRGISCGDRSSKQSPSPLNMSRIAYIEAVSATDTPKESAMPMSIWGSTTIVLYGIV